MSTQHTIHYIMQPEWSKIMNEVERNSISHSDDFCLLIQSSAIHSLVPHPPYSDSFPGKEDNRVENKEMEEGVVNNYYSRECFITFPSLSQLKDLLYSSRKMEYIYLLSFTRSQDWRMRWWENWIWEENFTASYVSWLCQWLIVRVYV